MLVKMKVQLLVQLAIAAVSAWLAIPETTAKQQMLVQPDLVEMHAKMEVQ